MAMNQQQMRPRRRSGGRSDIQSFYFSPAPTTGSFTITIDGNASDGIAYNASTTDIKTAIEAVTGIGSGKVTSVTGAGSSGDPYIVTFDASLGDVAQMTVNTGGLWEATPGGDTGFVPSQVQISGTWTNPSHASTPNNQRAFAFAAPGGASDVLRLADFAFGSLPADIAVTGFELEVERSGEVPDMIFDHTIALGGAETPESENKANATAWPVSDEVASYGGASDLWSYPWWPQSPAALSAIGVIIRAANVDTESRMASVDFVQARLYYSTLIQSAATLATVQEGA
jgi:hypothetical protein